jgi:hypothetical protein
MELFLPSVLLVLLAFLAIALFVPRFSPFFMFMVLLVILLVVGYQHIQQFQQEYAILSWAETAGSIAPYLLVGLVILLSLGYLLYLFGLRRGGGKSSGNAGLPSLPVPAAAPPPETATNLITQGINTGVRSIQNQLSAGPLNKNLISANPSLEKNVGTSQIRNVAESRLARQV